MTKVSIILPVYNSAGFIKATLNSIKNQTLKDIEVICIDDGSTDESLEILRNFAQADARFRVFSQPQTGQGAARNFGLKKANSSYIMFCDSDDLYKPDMCEIMFNTIQTESVDFCVCKSEVINISNNSIRSAKRLERYRNNFQSGKVKADTINVLLWNKIFKKKIIDKYNINFCNNPYDDCGFIYQYLAVSNYYYGIDINLYTYFIRNESVSDNTLTCKKQYPINAYLEDIIQAIAFIRELKLNIKNYSKFILEYILTYDTLKYRFFCLDKSRYLEFCYALKESLIPMLTIEEVASQPFLMEISNENYYKALAIMEFYIEPTPAFRENSVPVVFCVDEQYLKYLAVSIISIIKNSSDEHNYDIVIVYKNICVTKFTKIYNLIPKFKDNIVIRLVNISKFFDDNLANTTHSNYLTNYVSDIAYAKLLLPKIFNKYDKVIYLDVDTIILADLYQLYNIQLGIRPIAACIDLPVQNDTKFQKHFVDYCSQTLGIHCLENYFNSGVLLLQPKEILNIEDFLNKAKLLIIKNTKYFKDQNVLNALFYNNVQILPPEWNVQRFFTNQEKIPLEIKAVLNNAASHKIKHYIGAEKPWNSLYLEHADKWWHYARQTPFYEEILFENIRKRNIDEINSIRATYQNEVNQLKSETQRLQKENQHLNKPNLKKDLKRKKKKYLKYKILSNLLFGKVKQKYKAKRKLFKEQIRNIKGRILK